MIWFPTFFGFIPNSCFTLSNIGRNKMVKSGGS
jgi:hypothetical protein